MFESEHHQHIDKIIWGDSASREEECSLEYFNIKKNNKGRRARKRMKIVIQGNKGKKQVSMVPLTKMGIITRIRRLREKDLDLRCRYV